MNKHRLLWLGIILIVISTVFFIPKSFNTAEMLEEMTIPDEKMFEAAPFSDKNEELTITTIYHDSREPLPAQNVKWQKIRSDLSIYPKDGVEISNFYCTLILNDWITSKSSSPELKYMGVGKGYTGDIPADSKGVEAGMEKYVPIQVIDDPMYENALTSPVKIMLCYDSQNYYYYVTPIRKPK